MKKNIHPPYFMTVFTDISSGKKFKIGSTSKDITVEISSSSHPFYTGEHRILDIENRVDSFIKKTKTAASLKGKVDNKKQKVEDRRKTRVTKVNAGAALTLRDMLKNVA